MILRNFYSFSFLAIIAFIIKTPLAQDEYSSEKIESQLYYLPPSLNVQNMNITIGISSPLSKTRGSFNYQLYGGGVIAAICQADLINRKAYPPSNFNGTINLAVQDYTYQDPFGQGATIRLMKNDIYNKSTGQKVSNEDINNLAGFIGIESTGRNRINAEVTGGFIVPFVSPGTLSELDPADNFAIFSRIENRTFYTMRETILYSNINVFIELMAAYNWTIGANLFQNNVLGFDAQQALQAYISEKSTPIFTCNSIITYEDFAKEAFFTQYCKCIGKINDLNVIGIWASPPISYEIIKRIRKNFAVNPKTSFI